MRHERHACMNSDYEYECDDEWDDDDYEDYFFLCKVIYADPSLSPYALIACSHCRSCWLSQSFTTVAAMHWFVMT